MEILGTIFIITLGCLGHFIFEWSGHKTWAGYLFAVNESTWEHIKLTIFPAFLWLIPEVIVKGFSAGLIIAQFAGMTTMILLVPGLFYGYTAITKKNWLITDIFCFLIAVIAGMQVFGLVYNVADKISFSFLFYLSFCGLFQILNMFIQYSYHAPHNFLFRDPISGGYGPTGHGCHSDFHTHNEHHHHHHHTH